jgi:hypothetical protein
MLAPEMGGAVAAQNAEKASPHANPWSKDS